MIEFVGEEIAILDEGRHSILELPWKIPSDLGIVFVEVNLDPSMRARPMPYQGGSSVAVGASMRWGLPRPSISFSFSRPDRLVSENRRQIKFRIANFQQHLKDSPNSQFIEIPFEWINPYRVPPRIELNIKVKSASKKSINLFTKTLTGYNTSDGIIQFITNRDDSTFYFPQKSSVYNMPYWKFSNDAALYQAIPDTTVKSITWPTELAYWNSRAGSQYLVNQIRKINTKSISTVPVRIAICPFELDIPFDSTMRFLQELEAQSRLGVRIGVISPKKLFKIIDCGSSIAIYGNSIGLDYQGTDSPLSDGFLSVMLDSGRIAHLTGMYKELSELSIRWEDYKRKYRISFSREEDGIAVFNRQWYVKSQLGLKP